MSETDRQRAERILREVCVEILLFARLQEGRVATAVEIKTIEDSAAGLIPEELAVSLVGIGDELLRDGFRKHVEPGLRQWITGRIPS